MLITKVSEIYTDDLCIKIYNPNTKKVIGAFSSFKKASSRLGISAKTLQTRSENKKRIFSEHYGIEIAVRCGKTKEGDIELIQKTLKNKQL